MIVKASSFNSHSFAISRIVTALYPFSLKRVDATAIISNFLGVGFIKKQVIIFNYEYKISALIEIVLKRFILSHHVFIITK